MNRTEFLKIGGLLVIFGIAPILTSVVLATNHQNLSESTQTSVVFKPISQKNTASIPNIATNLPEPIIESEPSAITPQVAPPEEIQPAPPKVNLPQKTLNTAQAETVVPTIPSCSGNLSQEFMCLLNNYRATKGLGKVSLNNSLSEVAVKHSAWMDTTGIFSHTGIDGSRLNERCAAAGIRCLAENLAEEIYTAGELLSAWSANPSHDKNLLGPYHTFGLGLSGSYVTLLLN